MKVPENSPRKKISKILNLLISFDGRVNPLLEIYPIDIVQ